MDEVQLSVPEVQSEGMSGTTIAIIILIIIVVIAIVVIIIVLVMNNGSSSPRPPGPVCLLPPEPINLTAVRFNSYVTVSWNTMLGVDSYNVYYRIGNANVCANNFDGKINTSSTSTNFNNLPNDKKIYFAVTAINHCGEGPPSKIVSVDAIMPLMKINVLPDKADSPTVELVSNNCYYAKNSVIVNLNYSDTNSRFYLLQGTGQHGTVDDYLYIMPGPGPANQLALKCGIETTHTLTTLKLGQKSEILNPDAPKTLDSTFDLEWKPLTQIDQYVIFLASQDRYGNFHHVGGFTTDTKITLDTNPGDNVIFGLVLGFKNQDLSGVSDTTIFSTN